MNRAFSMSPELSELIARWHQQQRQEQMFSLAELCADCPEQLPELQRHVEAVQAMEAFLGLGEAAASSTQYPPQSSLKAASADTLRDEELTPIACPAGYAMLGELGRGGMGVVYKARQLSLNRVVALKKILAGAHARPGELARFRREAEAIARLQHPNIVQIYEVGEHHGLPFFALEFVSGGTLADKLQGTVLPAREAAALVQTLARSVHATHQCGIIHRDLKPANVLLTPDGTPKLTDFGLARRVEVGDGLTATGIVMGTPSYMAPEQARGETKHAGPAADVYALGAILYECLTGRPPFQAATALDTVLQLLDQEVVSVRRLQPRTDVDLATICHKCLQKEPSKRYASALELADDLERWQAGKPIQARATGRMERSLKWVQRHPTAAATYGLLLVVLVLSGLGGSAAWLWQRAERARQEAESARGRLAELSSVHRIGRAYREWQDADVQQAERLLEQCPAEYRGWEWNLVNHLCHQELCTLEGHASLVEPVAFRSDGRRLASASDDGTVKIWDVQTRRELLSWRAHEGSVRCVVFSPDGRFLGSAGNDNIARVWDAQTGALRLVLRHKEDVATIAFSVDGRFLATASPASLRLWDRRSGQELRTFQGMPGRINGMALSGDGKLLAASSEKGRVASEVKVWNLASGQEMLTLEYPDRIFALAFSPDNKRLAGTSLDKTVPIWEVGSGRMVLTLRGHTDRVNGLAFSPDGCSIATTSSDQTARVWDAATGQELVCHRGHQNAVDGVAFSPDGERLATASWDGTVKIWKARETTCPALLRGHTDSICDVKISPDGQTLASSDLDGMIRLSELHTGRELFTIRGPARQADALDFAPSGALLAAGGHDGRIRLWDTRTGQEVRTLVGHTKPVQCITFHPDGSRIASVSCTWDKMNSPIPGEVKVWDVQTGEEISLLPADTRGICVAFSPDGRRLACGSEHTLTVWDLATGGQELSWVAHDEGIVAVAFSPDGRRLASASFDKTVKVWDAARGVGLMTFRGHTARVTCMVFSPEGTRLASGGDDHVVRISLASSGEETLSLKGTNFPVNCLAFSPDGNVLVSGSGDRLVRVWDARPRQ